MTLIAMALLVLILIPQLALAEDGITVWRAYNKGRGYQISSIDTINILLDLSDYRSGQELTMAIYQPQNNVPTGIYNSFGLDIWEAAIL